MTTEYFTCPSFAITMPVMDCRKRRAAHLDDSKGLGNLGVTPGSITVKTSMMTRQCQACTEFMQLTAPENRITHEQMMERLRAAPSQEANKKHAQNRGMSNVHSPFSYRRNLP